MTHQISRLQNYPHKPTVSTPEVKLICKGHIAVSPQSQGLPKMPKYHAYTTLRNNILAEDDEVMRYFPYFGEEAAENDTLDTLNLEEAYVDRTKSMQEDNQRGESKLNYFLTPTSWSRPIGSVLSPIQLRLDFLLGTPLVEP